MAKAKFERTKPHCNIGTLNLKEQNRIVILVPSATLTMVKQL